MYLFSRKPLSNTEYNRSDHSIVNKTCDSYIIKIPHTRQVLENKISKRTCWQFAGATISFLFFLPHITNRGDAHLCRKVTTFYINLQRAGCQSARCLNPPHPTHPPTLTSGLIKEDDGGVEIRKWTLDYKSPKL